VETGEGREGEAQLKEGRGRAGEEGREQWTERSIRGSYSRDTMDHRERFPCWW